MTEPAGEKSDPRRWGVLSLLFFSIAINLLDRQVLSVMAPLIRDDLHLSNTEYSWIVASFLLGMTLAQAPAGRWLDHKGPRRGLPVIMAIWSGANALHALARNVLHLCGFRFLLGIGECGNYSAGVKVVARWFPPSERALAGGIFNSGTVLGAAVAPAMLVAVAQRWGWRATFLVPSLAGLIWIVPWLAFYREREEDAGTKEGRRPAVGFGDLLRMRPVWGVMLMRALGGPVMHFYWYWLPEYLKRDRHFSLESMGFYAGIPFVTAGLGNLAGGWISGLLMERRRSADVARKTVFAGAGALCAMSWLVPLVPGQWLPVLLISLATFGVSAYSANHIGLLTDLFPQRALGAVTGLAGLCEGSLNLILTLLTGAVVDRMGYLPVFVMAGLLPGLGVVALFGLIGKVKSLEQEFPDRDPTGRFPAGNQI